MIKSLSPYYIDTPWLSPLTNELCTSYTLDVFVWNGGKGNSGNIPTYSITKDNLENSIGVDRVNISRLVNDFLYINPVSTNTTDNINGNNQIWVKTQVIYTTSNNADTGAIQNTSVQLLLKGYGYGMDGENPQPPSDKIYLTGREFDVYRNSSFSLPVLADEVGSTIDAVDDSYTIFNLTQDLVVLSNDNLGFVPTTITSLMSDLDPSIGQFNNLGNVVQYQSNGTIGAPEITSFTYTITDSTGASDTATVNITINVAPVLVQAIDDYYELNSEDVAILDVMSNDVLGTEPTDIISFDDSGLTSGSITNNGNNLTFTPNGVIPLNNQTFTYTIEDDTSSTSQATVTLRVTNAENRYLLYVVNIGLVSGSISGLYSDGTPFSFNVPPNDRIDINRCVIESSLVDDPDILEVFDDNINC